MPANNQMPRSKEHGGPSQSAEDEPYQHGPLSGQDDGDSPEKVAEGVHINRTSVGKLPNVPDNVITETPE